MLGLQLVRSVRQQEKSVVRTQQYNGSPLRNAPSAKQWGLQSGPQTLQWGMPSAKQWGPQSGPQTLQWGMPSAKQSVQAMVPAWCIYSGCLLQRTSHCWRP
jgi:hypothetical protein